MWKVDGNKQILQWQYGRIIICHQQPDFSDGQLITSQTLIQDGSDPTKKTSQANKSMEKTQLLLNHFHQKRMNRSSRLYIKGGGMILDLAGFAASIYMRGIKNITHIPTTLLAMVDGTVGGKTAINYKGVKNLIGSIITSPIDILIYVPYLYTLPRRELLNGMAQIIKMAAVYDQEYFQELSSNRITIHDLFNPNKAKRYQTLVDIVKKSLQIKIKVVLQDITESKEAKWLSFGHTLGHAMQLATGNIYKHGESVSVGMIKACQLAYKKGIIKDYSVIDRLKNTLTKFELPTELPIFYDRNQLVELMMQDKKNFVSGNSSTIQFVLIEQIGKMCSTGTTKIDKWETYDLICQAVSIQYPLQGINQQINKSFDFPSSKDLSQRFLFMSALNCLQNKTGIKINNFTVCECTNSMVNALKVFGFQILLNPILKSIQILSHNSQIKKGVLQVGNSGSTSKFTIPLCCLIQGEWQIQSDQRIAKRNYRQSFEVYKQIFDFEIHHLNEEYCLPMKIKAKGTDTQKIRKKLIHSSYLTTLKEEKAGALISPLAIVFASFLQQKGNPQKISQKISIMVQKNVESTKLLKGDTLATAKALKQFGIQMFQVHKQQYCQIILENRGFSTECSRKTQLEVQSEGIIVSQIYVISKLLQIKQFSHISKIKYQNSLIDQIHVLEGCVKEFLNKVSHNEVNNIIPTFDFATCPDSFIALVLFMINPIKQYQKQEYRFRIDIDNIKCQRQRQSNRIHLIIKNLKKIGMKIEQYENKIRVINGYNQSIFRNQNQIVLETQGDHRVAISMGFLCGFMSKKFPGKKFIIDSKKCIEKSFPEFLNYMSKLGFKIRGCQAFKYRKNDYLYRENQYAPIVFLGNAGSGKKQLAKKIAGSFNLPLIDLQVETLKRIERDTQKRIRSVRDFILQFGQKAFQQLDSQVFQHWINADFNTQHVIVTSDWLIDNFSNRQTLKREPYTVYIERSQENLNTNEGQEHSVKDSKMKFDMRSKYYEQCANNIINIPTNKTELTQINYVINSIKKIFKTVQIQKPPEGFILCLHEEPSLKNGFYKNIFENQQLQKEISVIQIRIDQLKKQGMTFRSLRQNLSKFMILEKFQKLPTILSIRTKEEFGSMSKQEYPEALNQARKIPTNFLDIQIANQPSLTKDFHYNFNKVIWTYHGSEQVSIKKILAMKYGMKKICLSPFTNQNQKLYQKLKKEKEIDICVLFGDRLSRLENKYQMVLPQTLNEQNKTGIYNIYDMKSLRVLSKLLAKNSQEH